MSKDRKAARRRVGLAIVLLVLVAGLLGAWWESRRWTPDRARFLVQGAWLDTHDGAVDWPMLKARGADFVYLTASEGPSRRDEAFTAALEAARGQKLKVGAVHVYDLCAPADAQAANFVTIVPRDRAMLPPAIALDLDSRSCPAPPGEAAMQSELTTFLNQIEKTHRIQGHPHGVAQLRGALSSGRNGRPQSLGPAGLYRAGLYRGRLGDVDRDYAAAYRWRGGAGALGGGEDMSGLDAAVLAARALSAFALRLCTLFRVSCWRGAAVCRWVPS